MTKLAIVILNWNGKKFLEQFLPTLIAHTPSWAEIIIADNASTDDSVAFLQSQYPPLRLIQNDQNYGFAGGYNQALAQVQAEYYCLLNSDIEVTAQWVEGIVDYMDTHQEVGICQPKLLSWHNRQQFEYAGAAGGFIDKYGYPFCRGRIFNNIETDNGQYDDICEIFWATGACLFVRSTLFHQVGGLDADFFAHMEEIDFCWRVKHLGYKVMYYPYSHVFHIGGGTLPKSSPQKTYLNFRNDMLLLYKNLPKKKWLAVFIVRVFLDWIAALKFLTGKGGWQEFYAVFRARRDFYKMRKATKQKSQYSKNEVSNIYNKSIVWTYYGQKITQFSHLPKENFTK